MGLSIKLKVYLNSWMVYFMVNPTKLDDPGVPRILGNHQMLMESESKVKTCLMKGSQMLHITEKYGVRDKCGFHGAVSCC